MQSLIEQTPVRAATGANEMAYSTDPAHLREIREIEQSKGTFFAYVSQDSGHITGWRGNKLMSVTSAKRTGAGSCGKTLHIRANDAHGREWYGKNGGPGMGIQMKLKKV